MLVENTVWLVSRFCANLWCHGTNMGRNSRLTSYFLVYEPTLTQRTISDLALG